MPGSGEDGKQQAQARGSGLDRSDLRAKQTEILASV